MSKEVIEILSFVTELCIKEEVLAEGELKRSTEFGLPEPEDEDKTRNQQLSSK
jgi:hypothetical protein